MLNKKIVSGTGFNFNNSYARLPKVFFTKQNPSSVPSPNLVILNHNLIKDLGLNIEVLNNKEGIEVFAGNNLPEGSEPICEAYAGHQFGYFTLLGDGRAVLLGEHITPINKRFDIQLKGSGRTPYSRGGDGLAALGPMLREYIISEAMYGLGIPTTRSLAVVTTGRTVIREKKEIGAVLTRVASSHIRVGTFQYASKWGTFDDLKALADYTITRHFPNLQSEENPYVLLLEEVVKKQAELISKWQLVGFIHGVMNTDNISISGETIDYGPCAFMDTFNLSTVFSSIDINGRYAYGNQPTMAAWDLARFAEAILPLLNDNEEKAIEIAQNTVSKFSSLFQDKWMSGMKKKLGLFNDGKEDKALIDDLLSMMQKYKADYTNTFIALTFNKLENISMFQSEEFKKWYELWQGRLKSQKESKDLYHKLMKDNNPALIPRNHRVEEALEAAIKRVDYSVMEKFIKALSKPYEHSKEQADYSILPETKNCSYKTYCGT